METALVLAILALWTAIHPSLSTGKERLAIATAIARVHIRHASEPPLLGISHYNDALTEAYYVAKESSVHKIPTTLYSWDAITQVSCGMLQEPCEFVTKHTDDLIAQAEWWYSAVKASNLGSVDSSPSRAAKRVAWVNRHVQREFKKQFAEEGRIVE
jgi:hypothetical protein